MNRNSRTAWREPIQDKFNSSTYQNRMSMYPIGPTISENYKYQPIYGGTSFQRPQSPFVSTNNYNNRTKTYPTVL